MTETRIKKFTTSQVEALEKFALFKRRKIKNPMDYDSRVIVIIGPAGSGKTTIIRYALEYEIQKDLDAELDDEKYGGLFQKIPNVVGVSVAHKAKNNLRKSVPFTKTFAGYFNMDEHVDENGVRTFVINAMKIGKSLCRQPVKYAVHDEVSMYDNEMIDTILRETHPDTKIILMGDDCQNPPVSAGVDDDSDSPAFTMFSNVIELRERVRQGEDNPLLEVCDIIREEIRGSQNMKRCYDAMKGDKINSKGKGFKNIFYRDFLKTYKNITSNYMEAKVIAYRKKAIENYNTTIRNYLYPTVNSLYVPGEIIYMNDTFRQEFEGDEMIYDDHLDALIKKEYFTKDGYYCYNSDEYTITKVGRMKVDKVECYQVFVDYPGRDDVYIPLIHPNGNELFKKNIYGIRQKALSDPDPFKRKQHWAMYYSYAKHFGNASYAYALTGHKAQGSGYKYVFVDVNDIVTVSMISNKRKLQALYTAMTRAEDLAIFLKSK